MSRYTYFNKVFPFGGFKMTDKKNILKIDKFYTVLLFFGNNFLGKTSIHNIDKGVISNT